MSLEGVSMEHPEEGMENEDYLKEEIDLATKELNSLVGENGYTVDEETHRVVIEVPVSDAVQDEVDEITGRLMTYYTNLEKLRQSLEN
jgi:hypothetical protein